VECPAGASEDDDDTDGYGDGDKLKLDLLAPAEGAGTVSDSESRSESDAVPLSETGLGLLVITGAPIGEKVVKYGPFVMNSQEEIVQAMRDFHAGKLGGHIAGADERRRKTEEAKRAQEASGTWSAGDKEL